MTIDYTITPEDYIRAVKLHHSFTRKKAMIFFLFVSLIAFTVLVIKHAPFDIHALVAWIGGILSAAVWLWFYQKLLLPMLAKRDYKRYKSIQEPMRLTLAEEAIMIDKENSHFEIAFKNLLQYRENNDTIILYPMPRLFYIFPKKLAQKGFDFHLLHERLAHYNIPKVS